MTVHTDHDSNSSSSRLHSSLRIEGNIVKSILPVDVDPRESVPGLLLRSMLRYSDKQLMVRSCVLVIVVGCERTCGSFWVPSSSSLMSWSLILSSASFWTLASFPRLQSASRCCLQLYALLHPPHQLFLSSSSTGQATGV